MTCVFGYLLRQNNRCIHVPGHTLKPRFFESDSTPNVCLSPIWSTQAMYASVCMANTNTSTCVWNPWMANRQAHDEDIMLVNELYPVNDAQCCLTLSSSFLHQHKKMTVFHVCVPQGDHTQRRLRQWHLDSSGGEPERQVRSISKQTSTSIQIRNA